MGLVIEYTDIGRTINWKPLQLGRAGKSPLQLINMEGYGEMSAQIDG